MIDWSKESTDKNYCGYCKNDPTSWICDGGCFIREHYSPEKILENKSDHVLEELRAISIKIDELKQREMDLRKETVNCISHHFIGCRTPSFEETSEPSLLFHFIYKEYSIYIEDFYEDKDIVSTIYLKKEPVVGFMDSDLKKLFDKIKGYIE